MANERRLPILNDKVNVGACVEIVCEITDSIVSVKGIYYYMGGHKENWCFSYKRETFNKAEWNQKFNEWDADRDDIEPFNYYHDFLHKGV